MSVAVDLLGLFGVMARTSEMLKMDPTAAIVVFAVILFPVALGPIGYQKMSIPD